MATSRGIEYSVPSLDGDVEERMLFHEDYPVAFQLIGEPEPWESIVARHTQASELQITTTQEGEQ